jgi:hypothetical protein
VTHSHGRGHRCGDGRGRGRRGRVARCAATLSLGLLGGTLTWAPAAGADSFTPVRLKVTVAPVARLDRPLAVSVNVSADADVLDNRTAPLRIRVKLAGECGGDFSNTSGAVLMDARLNPQPAVGLPYNATAGASGTPPGYGAGTVCVFLEEEGDNRQFASDMDSEVNVSQACTVAADRLDRASRVLAAASRQLRRDRAIKTRGIKSRPRRARAVARRKRLIARQRVIVARDQKIANADRRAALSACGRGVAL